MSRGSWEPIEPAGCAAWFAGLPVRWWVAGGWALDLFLGRTTRRHTDLDIGVLRSDLGTVLRHLADWELFESKDERLTPVVDGTTPAQGVNSLWCRRLGSDRWTFELLIDDAVGDVWRYRRNPSVQRPLDTLVRHDASGLPYLVPEIQLLYKARSVRPRDQLDFDDVSPQLDAAARVWLRDALVKTEGPHPWLSYLSSAGDNQSV